MVGGCNFASFGLIGGGSLREDKVSAQRRVKIVG